MEKEIMKKAVELNQRLMDANRQLHLFQRQLEILKPHPEHSAKAFYCDSNPKDKVDTFFTSINEEKLFMDEEEEEAFYTNVLSSVKSAYQIVLDEKQKVVYDIEDEIARL